MRSIEIQPDSAGQRLDKFLLKYLTEAPKSFVYEMIRKKNIKLNGKKADGGEILAPGDTVDIFLSDETVIKFSSEKKIINSSGMLDIIYEDNNIIVVNKPPGVLTHKAEPNDADDMTERLKKYLYDKNEFDISRESVFTPAFCNRLDKNTTGVLIGGKNLISLKQLSRVIAQRATEKLYTAILPGALKLGCRLSSYHHKE